MKSIETWNFKCLVQLVGSFVVMDAHHHLLQALYPCSGALPKHETFIIEMFSLVKELLKMIWHCPKFSSVEIRRWFFFSIWKMEIVVRKKKIVYRTYDYMTLFLPQCFRPLLLKWSFIIYYWNVSNNLLRHLLLKCSSWLQNC